MTRVTETGQLISDDGRPVMMGDAAPPRGEHAGVTITRAEDFSMAKAEQDGIYRVGRTRIKVRKGDVIPAGAEPVETRKEDAAPENKAKAAAPENRKKA